MPQLPISNGRAMAHLLADPARMQVLAAVALGASNPDAVIASTGLSYKDATTCLRRLQDAWLVTAGDSGLAVRYERIASMVPPPGPAPTAEEKELAPFVAGNKLRSLPAKPGRRRRILEHVVETSFSPDEEYDEKTVNRLLSQWCEGGELDHVTVRRYLVDAQLLIREAGTYRRSAA